MAVAGFSKLGERNRVSPMDDETGLATSLWKRSVAPTAACTSQNRMNVVVRIANKTANFRQTKQYFLEFSRGKVNCFCW